MLKVLSSTLSLTSINKSRMNSKADFFKTPETSSQNRPKMRFNRTTAPGFCAGGVEQRPPGRYPVTAWPLQCPRDILRIHGCLHDRIYIYIYIHTYICIYLDGLRQIDSDRQTDRQTSRQRQAETDRQTEGRQAGRQTNTQRAQTRTDPLGNIVGN